MTYPPFHPHLPPLPPANLGLVVHNKEHFFGYGISSTPAGRTPFGQPDMVICLGNTEVPHDMVEGLLADLRSRYRPQDYNVSKRHTVTWPAWVFNFWCTCVFHVLFGAFASICAHVLTCSHAQMLTCCTSYPCLCYVSPALPVPALPLVRLAPSLPLPPHDASDASKYHQVPALCGHQGESLTSGGCHYQCVPSKCGGSDNLCMLGNAADSTQ